MKFEQIFGDLWDNNKWYNVGLWESWNESRKQQINKMYLKK